MQLLFYSVSNVSFTLMGSSRPECPASLDNKNINSTIRGSMESVTQQDNYGCGVACVAYISKRTYRATLKTLDAKAAKTRGFACKDLVIGLNTIGHSYTYSYLPGKLKRKIYADGVIVFIKRSEHYPAGHYLVRSQNKWMDPWLNFKKDRNIKKAESGYRARLPGKPVYALFPN